MAPAQIGKHRESVPVWQVEIQQDQMQIGMCLDQAHRLSGIRRLQHRRLRCQFLENAAQRVADQRMVVDEKNLHARHISGRSRWRILQTLIECIRGAKNWGGAQVERIPTVSRSGARS
jgi:hypothetical protein